MVDGNKNLVASIRQRLLNLSRAQGQVFDVILVRYALERLIYRLSSSKHRDNFVLKGGMLVTLWTDDENRVTRDADFLAHGKSDAAHLKDVFTDIMSLEFDDGLVFDTDALVTSEIREEQEYGGVRLKTTAYLGNVRIPITVDIGIGDAVADPNYTIDYPSLLDMPSANIRAYPPATVVAEKFHAIVTLGLANSRMKDYYDLWSIPNALNIEATALDDAIRTTFERRRTAVPFQQPIGLSTEFVTDEQKSRQWTAYAASIDLKSLSLEEVVQSVWTFVEPACRRLNDNKV
jgi:predicted nucleotidyltransferase component of viral defense system